ncbi:MAG: hypothetical protein BMS9Abin23_0911 [Thermodesulfobacteriota bacterium]|nr:MAG: hypothetical protein BMS9Abin23_0911 [Thermodesulfobacteriota bacterium]
MKKVLLVLLAFSALIAAAVIVFLFLFIKSQSFVPFAERVLSKNIGKEVRIGSIALNGNVVTITNISIKEGNSPLVTVARADVGFSLFGLMGRRLDRVSIKRPEIFLRPGKSGSAKVRSGPRRMPVFFKQITIEDGTIVISPDKKKSLTVGPVNISLDASSRKKAALRGDIFLPLLDSRVSLSAVLDMERLTVDRGHVDVSTIELKKLTAKGLTLFKDTRIRGAVKAGLEVRKKDGLIEVELKTLFKGLGVGQGKIPGNASGQLKALFKFPVNFNRVDGGITLEVKARRGGPGRLNAALKGSYIFKGRELVIKEVVLASPLLGGISMEGTFREFLSRNMSVSAGLSADVLSLSGIDTSVLTPMSLVPEGMKFAGTLKGKASVKGSLSKGLNWQSNFTFTGLSIMNKFFGVDLKDRPLVLSGRGGYNHGDETLKIDLLKARIRGLGSARLKGSFKKILSGKPETDVKIETTRIPLNPLKALVSGNVSDALRGLDVQGSMGLGLVIKSGPTLSVVSGALIIKGKRFRSEAVEAKDFELLVPIDLRGSILRAENFSFKAGNASVKRDGKKIHQAKNPFFKGTLKGDLGKRLFKIRKLSFKAGPVMGGAEKISLDLNDPIRASAEVELPGLDTERLWPELMKHLNKGTGIEAKGALDIRSTLKAVFFEKSRGRVNGNIRMRLKDGAFSTPDGNAAGDGFNIGAAGDFDISLADLSVKFNVRAQAGDFELLAGDFYGDFTKIPVGLSLNGEYGHADNSLKISQAELTLGEAAKVFIKGAVKDVGGLSEFNAGIRLKSLSNKKIYDLFIRDTFGEGLPLLTRIDVDGTADMNISARGSVRGFNARGGFNLTEVGVTDRDGKSGGPLVEGLNMDLPFDITYPGVGNGDKDIKAGSLNIKKVSWGGLTFHDLEAKPSIRRNSLVFNEDIVLPLFNGEVRLARVSYNNLLSTERELSLSVDIKDIDLGEASIALGMPRFSGRLSGTIPTAVLKGTSLTTEGEIVLNLFGGEGRIKEIAAEGIFGPAPSFRSTVEFKEIDLGKLTDTFEFGHITGILEGYVKDLEIVNGQPQAFEAVVETVRRRGVSQRISTSALEKISILGTGAAASALNRGIYRLFNEYRYKKMGFSARLKNDQFLLIGIETVGDKGYIIKGGLLPPKVDVISYTQLISFKEMVKRLKRIELIGTGDGGAVVE